MNRSHFDKLYIIGLTGGQDESFNKVNGGADVKIIGKMMDLPAPDRQPKEMVKTMIFDDARVNEKV